MVLVSQGLAALGYSEHIDYDLVESTNPAFHKAIVRVNVFRDHRQVMPIHSPVYRLCFLFTVVLPILSRINNQLLAKGNNINLRSETLRII